MLASIKGEAIIKLIINFWKYLFKMADLRWTCIFCWE